MAEYIGLVFEAVPADSSSKISLISKRDVRYVGILHEISSEHSTVALENVRSYGTEGRSAEEIPPSDDIYEYIVFRGSDVKDLRIEQEPERKPQSKVPDDPAILGNARPGRPYDYPQQSYPYSSEQHYPSYGGPPNYPQHGFSNHPYGPPPPGWYPPPPHGFSHPPGPPFQAEDPSFRPQEMAPEQKPPPPTATKPDVAAALAPPVESNTKSIPTGPKSRIKPAIPIKSPNLSKVPTHPPRGILPNIIQNDSHVSAPHHPPPEPLKHDPPTAVKNEDANRNARAAVAAAMAKLSHPATNDVDEMTKQFNEVSTHEVSRGGQTRRGGRAGRGRGASTAPKIELPKFDYDFEQANAKFNKQDLVREAIANGDVLDDGSAAAASSATSGPVTPNTAGYNKSSSFFDNISSEIKDREETTRLRGREFRTEEQKKNVETFGQGTVDHYRGRYRGRGRGRGRGFRGRGHAAPHPSAIAA